MREVSFRSFATDVSSVEYVNGGNDDDRDDERDARDDERDDNEVREVSFRFFLSDATSAGNSTNELGVWDCSFPDCDRVRFDRRVDDRFILIEWFLCVG